VRFEDEREGPTVESSEAVGLQDLDPLRWSAKRYISRWHASVYTVSDTAPTATVELSQQ